MKDMYRSTIGQSLVEMVVVIAVVILLATGIISGTSATLARTQSNQLRSTALQYAQEGTERARALRDAGWNTFAPMGSTRDVPPISSPTRYCVGDDGIFQPSPIACTPNIHGKYIRTVTLALINPSDPVNMYMAVDVVVSWGDTSKPNNSVELKTDLTAWK
jgi:type II secretory pathway pseudopilin PulG